MVALALGHAALFQDQDGRHAELFGAGRRQHGVVRLGAAGRKDDLRALPLRVGEQELELAHLVAAEADARQIIALDIDIGAEQAADVLQLLDRRRQRRQTDAGEILQILHNHPPKILMAVMDWNMAHTHRFYYATTACRCQKVPRQAALLFQPTHYKPLSPIGKAGNSNASHKRSEWLYQCRFAPVSIDPRNTTNRS